MENYYLDDSGSVNSILNSFSSDMFDGITFVMRPVVGGIDHLRQMHKAYQFQKEINKISNISFETREKILDALTDIVVGKTFNDDLKDDFENKLSEFDNINEVFKNLENLTTKIDQRQLPKIFRLSLIKLNGRISSIRDEINRTMWNKGENVNQLLVLDQIFYLIQEIINDTLNEPIDKLFESVSWSVLMSSLLYVEAFHRNKVTFTDVQDFLSELNIIGYKENQNLKNNAIFEVLAT